MKTILIGSFEFAIYLLRSGMIACYIYRRKQITMDVCECVLMYVLSVHIQNGV